MRWGRRAPAEVDERPRWTTAQIRAVDIAADDVVVVDGHAWQLTEGEAWDVPGGDPVAEWRGACAVQLHLARPRFTNPLNGPDAMRAAATNPAAAWVEGRTGDRAWTYLTLNLAAEDLLTVQVQAP